MWIFFTITCVLMWGAADLFYKKGAEGTEKYSHLKTSVWVGIVMGVQAIGTLVVTGMEYDPINILLYLPVSMMYIISMTVGYLGLKYLELSVCSPVQNTSGAVVCLLCVLILGKELDLISTVGVSMVCISVFTLGVTEYLIAKNNPENLGQPKKYYKSVLAFLIPVVYCTIDALGTFLDAYYLDDIATTPLKGVTEETLENTANISYELTYLICAIILYVFIRVGKKERLISKKGTTVSRVVAATFETLGQYVYVFAMSGNAVIAAPIVSGYFAISLLLSRIFLKEKLKVLQYVAIGVTLAGIILLGISSPE